MELYVKNTLLGPRAFITLHIVALVAKISFFIFACDIYPVDIRGERMKKSGEAFQKTEHPLHCKGQVPSHKLALQIH